MLHSTYHSALPVIRTLVQIFLPFMILAAFCLAWMVAYCILRRRGASPGTLVGREWLGRRLQLTSYSVLGYFYPSIAQACLTIFSCYPVDNPIPAGTLYPEHLQVSPVYGDDELPNAA